MMRHWLGHCSLFALQDSSPGRHHDWCPWAMLLGLVDWCVGFPSADVLHRFNHTTGPLRTSVGLSQRVPCRAVLCHACVLQVAINSTRLCEHYINRECLAVMNADACVNQLIDSLAASASGSPGLAPTTAVAIAVPLVAGELSWHTRGDGLDGSAWRGLPRGQLPATSCKCRDRITLGFYISADEAKQRRAAVQLPASTACGCSPVSHIHHLQQAIPATCCVCKIDPACLPRGLPR